MSHVRNKRLTFRQYIKRSKSYIRNLDVCSAFMFIVSLFTGRTRKVHARFIRSPYKGRLWLRTNSSDYLVALETLVGDELRAFDLNDPRVIIDGGANIGSSALVLAERYPEARVIAVEMEAENYKMLVMNVGGNKSITAIRGALLDRTGTAAILSDIHQSAWGFTVVEQKGKALDVGQETACFTLDGLMQQYQLDRLDFLKLDIEGAEAAVFRNSAAWIDRVEAMLVELHGHDAEAAFDAATKHFHVRQVGEKSFAMRAPLAE